MSKLHQEIEDSQTALDSHRQTALDQEKTFTRERNRLQTEAHELRHTMFDLRQQFIRLARKLPVLPPSAEEAV
jgi:predicted  nucleic acid-binding Zn-ribbon protein